MRTFQGQRRIIKIMIDYHEEDMATLPQMDLGRAGEPGEVARSSAATEIAHLLDFHVRRLLSTEAELLL